MIAKLSVVVDAPGRASGLIDCMHVAVTACMQPGTKQGLPEELGDIIVCEMSRLLRHIAPQTHALASSSPMASMLPVDDGSPVRQTVRCAR